MRLGFYAGLAEGGLGWLFEWDATRTQKACCIAKIAMAKTNMPLH
jgi:hypothetical protein